MTETITRANSSYNNKRDSNSGYNNNNKSNNKQNLLSFDSCLFIICLTSLSLIRKANRPAEMTERVWESGERELRELTVRVGRGVAWRDVASD